MARPGRNFKAPRPFEKPTKVDFMEMVAEVGKTVTVERVDVGRWNERREFVVDGKRVGSVMKSDKADWFEMMEAFTEEFGSEGDKAQVRFMKGRF